MDNEQARKQWDADILERAFKWIGRTPNNDEQGKEVAETKSDLGMLIHREKHK